MQRINIQYPYDCTGENRLFDGQVHQVTPSQLSPIKIGDRTFYIMQYFDHSAYCESITLLTEINGTFAKVPLNLDGYDYLFDYMDSIPLKQIPLDGIKLPNKIALAQTLNSQDLFHPPGPPHNSNDKDKNVMNWTRYVPINTNGKTNVLGSVFASQGIMSKSAEQTYQYQKDASFSLRDSQIQRGVDNYYYDENGNKCYDFTIDVRPGTTAVQLSIDSEGKMHRQDLLVIPGIHKYHIVYGDCYDYNDYIAAKKSSKMTIEASYPEYRDLHDEDRAFVDGMGKRLLTRFHSYDGKATTNNYNANNYSGNYGIR